MASTSDIRDIMNLGQAGPRQPAPKKKKHTESQPRVTGVRREVQALMGDSVPPIAIVEQRSYKSRPSISQKLFKPRRWEERTFEHGTRTDGLVLRHWKRSIPGASVRTPAVSNGTADVEMTDDTKATSAGQASTFEEEYPSHKWNVTVQVPVYTDDQYENMLKSEDWSRQETDYLMDLCRDYDLRWMLIADRYTTDDIPPSLPTTKTEDGTTMEVVLKSHYPPRSMETLKQRYYSIAAKIMESITPASTMTATEFQLWEKMRTFDAKTETMRKAMAEKLFERTKDEADEERILLEELHRITKNEDDFVKMRRDLYARLEPVTPLRRSGNGEEQSTAMYQTSGGLSMLLQSLLAKEKRLKRPAVPEGASGSASAATPVDPRHDKARQSSQYTRRDTMDTQATNDEPQKKSSISQAPTVRILAPTDAAKFGVSHPQERLTSGVQFRHEKINRLTMAKSQTQTTKIQAALNELGIPARLLMPTERVCREFERLVGEINILLDSRKLSDKVSSEIRVLEEQRRIRLGLPKEDGDTSVVDGNEKGWTDVRGFPNATDAMEIDDSQLAESTKVDDSMAVAEEDQDAEAEDDEPTQLDAAEDQEQDNDDSAIQANQQARAAVNGADPRKSDEDDGEEEDQDADDIAGLANEDEDDDQDGEDDRDDGLRLGRDDDDDEDDEQEDDDEGDVVANTTRDDSAFDDEEEDEEAGADSEDEGEDRDDEVEADEDDSDVDAETESRVQAAVGGSEEVDSDSEDEQDAAPAANQVDADDSDEEAAEEDGKEDNDEDESSPPPAALPTTRPTTGAHKRSASVISEASRADSHRSNRSGMGRKKRR